MEERFKRYRMYYVGYRAGAGLVGTPGAGIGGFAGWINQATSEAEAVAKYYRIHGNALEVRAVQYESA